MNGLCSSYTSSLLRLDSSTLGDGTVASDLYAVAQAMNNINNSIKNNSALQGMNYVTDSTSSIPSKLYDVQSSVLGITSGVVNNLSQETSLIANMANVIYEMDKDLANRAGNLSNGDGLLTKYSDQIEAELNKVIDNNITGMLNIRESLFSPGTHAEGTIGKICASDIGQMISGGNLTGPLKDNIESEKNDAKKTKTEIENFKNAITSSKNLQGEMWKKVGVKLDKYSNLMDLRMESMNKLETAYEESLNLIKDYMGEYEYLDDSELPELRQALTELKSAIDNAKNILSKTHEETRTKGEGDNITTYTVTVYDYSASARAAASAYIKWAGEQVIEVEKLITKLEGLADIMSQAEQIINDALIEIYGKYGTEANSVVTGKKSEYIPPANTNYTPKRLSEDAFNKDKILIEEYGTYDNYKNYNKISKYDASIKGEYNQYTRHEFLVRSKPVEEFGTYENYLQGVKKEDDPAFNKEIEDKGKDIDIDLKIPEKGIIESIQEAQKKQEDLAKDAQSKQSSASPSSGSSSPSNSHSGGSSNSSGGSSTQPSSEPSKEEPTNNVEPQTPTDQGDIKVEPTDNQTEKPVEEIKPNENKPSQTIPTTPSKPSKPSKPSSSIPNNRINSGTKETNKVETNTVETPEIIEIEPIEIEPIEEEPIIVEPIIEPEIEEPIEIKPIEITPTSESTEETSKTNSTLKTVGTILGVGAAVGATAFGAHTVMKARENNNIYESDEEEEE